jgi:hypothetical protein
MTRHWSQVTRRASPGARSGADGTVFDSAGERERWEQLQFLEETGAIRDLRRQPKFDLVLPDGTPIRTRTARRPNGRRCSYTADYSYIDGVSGVLIVEDYKGFDLPVAKLRRAVAEAIYGFRVTLTGPAARRRVRRKIMPRRGEVDELDLAAA